MSDENTRVNDDDFKPMLDEKPQQEEKGVQGPGVTDYVIMSS